MRLLRRILSCGFLLIAGVDGAYDCWKDCGKKGGSCPQACGPGGYCCRERFNDPGCAGLVSNPHHHACVYGGTTSTTHPLPPLTPSEPSFELIGCFHDLLNIDLEKHGNGYGDRAFGKDFVQYASKDAVSKCQWKCKGFCYMAVQYGGECRCASSPPLDGEKPKYGKDDKRFKQVENKKCNHEVLTGFTGATERKVGVKGTCSVEYGCGGAFTNSVYANTGIWSSVCAAKTPGPPSLLPKFELLGCWMNLGDELGFEAKTYYHFDPPEAVRRCKEKCKDSCYMGLRAGGECRCASLYPPESRKKESDCNTAKDSCGVKYGCGGSHAKSVYYNKPLWSSKLCAGKIGPPTPAPTPSPTTVRRRRDRRRRNRRRRGGARRREGGRRRRRTGLAGIVTRRRRSEGECSAWYSFCGW